MKKIVALIFIGLVTFASAMAGFNCIVVKQQTGGVEIKNPDPMPMSAVIYSQNHKNDTIVVEYVKPKSKVVGQLIGTKDLAGETYYVYQTKIGFVYLVPQNIPAKKGAVFAMFQLTPVLNAYSVSTYGCRVDF